MTNTLRFSWWMVGLAALVTSCFQASGESDDDGDDDDPGVGGSGATSSGGSAGTTGGTAGGTTGATGGSGGSVNVVGGSSGTGGSGGSTGGSGGGTGGTGGTGGSTGGSGGGTGGSGAGTGGSTSGTGGSSGASTCGSAWNVDEGGYITSPGTSCWQGHAWTTAAGATSTVYPADFSACGTPCSLCAYGSVGAELDFSSVGILAMNLNQAPGDTVLGTVSPTGSGVTVSFSNPGGSPLRVQIQGPNGATDATDRWCYELAGASGSVTIPYGSFNTECWTNTGYAYAGEPLEALILLVPGSDIYDVPFDVCLLGASDT